MFKSKKILKIFSIFILVTLTISSKFVYADDIAPLEDSYDINKEIDDTESIETTSNNSDFPTINSRAYVVIDRKSNTIMLGKNEHQKKKMASTTKIMTSIVIIENYNLSDIVTISKKAANTGGSRLGLKTGDKISVHDLLYGLMLRSGNDAAVALAEYATGSIPGFATLMNQKANELGLENTHFVTPHGLDHDEHYTTAYELALLTNYALNNKIFSQIVSTKNYTITINGYPKALINTNELLGVLDGIYGVKTGFTNGANRCLVTSCKRGDMDIICVVLGADTKKFRTQDSIKLINYSFQNFTYIHINEKIETEFNKWIDENINSFSIYKGINNKIELYFNKLDYDYIPIKNDSINDIKISIQCNTNLTAPILSNYTLGHITVFQNDDILYTLDIKSKNNIQKRNILDYIYLFITNISN